MKSIVVQQPLRVVIKDKVIPQPKNDKVRIKIKLGGICGSDAQIYKGTNPFAKYPRVIGHEFFGVIDEVGEEIDRSRVGERVSVDPVISCGHCYPCSIGRPNVCTSLAVLGVHRDGGFSEYVTVPGKNAHVIPDNIPDEFAAMVEPFSIAANVTSRLQPTENDVALIFGSGPIGLTCLQVLKGVYHVKTVVVTDRIPERLNLALISGADKVINNAALSLRDELSRLNISPTLIIDAACHPSILQEAISLAPPTAKIIIMGFSTEPSQVLQQNITGKELTILSSRLNANKFDEVISWLRDKKIDPAKLITHICDFRDAASVFEAFDKGQEQFCKVLLSFE